MARNGLFGGRTESSRTEDERATGAIDRDRDGIDDRDEARDTRVLDRDGERAIQRDTVEPVEARTAPPPVVDPRTSVADRDGVDDRTQTTVAPNAPYAPVAPVASKVAVATVPARVVPARASMLATLGLVLGLVGTAAALTGRLAPVGVALGVIGLLLSFGGVMAGGKPHVAGRGLGSLGVLLSAAAIVFAILAMTHTASWLDSNVDQVAKLRDWMDQKMPWMSSW